MRDGENLNKMKEKGDPCILVGYSTRELSKASYYDNSGLAPQLQKTSNHNRSKLKTHNHNNEPSSLMLVPNVFPPADTNALMSFINSTDSKSGNSSTNHLARKLS
nr:hypothetical protein [Tanacetum cinerariifolium]